MSMTEKSDTLHHLKYGDKKVILVGTAHVSRDSAQEVGNAIQEEKPDTVCVELCPSRYQSIRQKERWQQTDIIKVIKEKNPSCCFPIFCWHRSRNESLKNLILIPVPK